MGLLVVLLGVFLIVMGFRRSYPNVLEALRPPAQK